ncbi:hypothetical protein HFN47_00380 [Rhizobium leguminosarum]|nr:hypothetical protein [Rhizobium leguminosarum]MBY5856303.1 hypothetical protein [Rhizobium leguminosarum]
MMTIEEGKRRTAIANMIIAEIGVANALNGDDCSPFNPKVLPFDGLVRHYRHGWIYPIGRLREPSEGAQACSESANALGEMVEENLRALYPAFGRGSTRSGSPVLRRMG